MSNTEEWRDIPTYEMYQASSLGEIMRKSDGLILKQYIQKSGYVYVWLNRGFGCHSVPVHRLVAYAFLGIKGYEDGLFVDHINTIRSDNRASNLRWVTPKENANNETTKLNRRKSMKAKEKALKEYPVGDTKLSDAAPSICRNAFIEGYNKEEKDHKQTKNATGSNRLFLRTNRWDI